MHPARWRPTSHVPCSQPARPPAALSPVYTSNNVKDRRQTPASKTMLAIRRASNVTNLYHWTSRSTRSCSTTCRSYRDHRLLWRHFTLCIGLVYLMFELPESKSNFCWPWRPMFLVETPLWSSCTEATAPDGSLPTDRIALELWIVRSRRQCIQTSGDVDTRMTLDAGREERQIGDEFNWGHCPTAAVSVSERD